MTAVTSRRGLLAASGLLAAGVGSVVGASKLGEDDPVNAARGLPSVLVSPRVRISRPGAEPGKLPPRGTPALPYGDLETDDGRASGRFDTSKVMGGRGALHMHRIELDNGVLVGLGSAGRDGRFTIVGASGDLAGATGAYLIRERGEGGLEFSFHDTKLV